jgi:hypothetical protein
MGAGRHSRPAAALVAAALLLAACGGADSDGGDRPARKGVVDLTAGSTAQFASCADWRRGTVAQRYATIADIRGQMTPQTLESEESDLSDRSAYRIFQRSCATDGSDQMRLYNIYARAQAFAPLRGEARG